MGQGMTPEHPATEPRILSENDLRLINQKATFNAGINKADLDNLIHTIRTLRSTPTPKGTPTP